MRDGERATPCALGRSFRDPVARRTRLRFQYVHGRTRRLSVRWKRSTAWGVKGKSALTCFVSEHGAKGEARARVVAIFGRVQWATCGLYDITG